MYSFQAKAETLSELGNKLLAAAQLFHNNITHGEPESTQLELALPPTPAAEEVSNHSIGEIRAEVTAQVNPPVRSRKPRAKKGEAPLATSSEVSAVSSTAAETPADNVVTISMRDHLTSRLNAFLEHEHGGIQPARDLLATFGAAKMSEIPEHRLEEVVNAINNVIGR
jgi:hypothetical protein